MSTVRRRPKFLIDEKVVCAYEGEFYLARCIKVRKSKSNFHYLIHYDGWSDNWDEWKSERRIIKMTKESFEKYKIEPPKQMDLPSKEEERSFRLKKAKKIPKKKNSKSSHNPKTLTSIYLSTTSACTSSTDEVRYRSKRNARLEHEEQTCQPPSATLTQNPNEISADPADNVDPISLHTDAKSDAESSENAEPEDKDDSSSTTSEVSFYKRAFYLKLPTTLKYTLIYDHDMITYRKALATLPAPKSVQTIVNEYLSVMNKNKRVRKSLYVEDIFKFLVDSFNALIGNILLYKRENAQFVEFSKTGKLASEAYGAVHLLRLLAKLDDILNEDFANKMTSKEIEGYENELNLFFSYVAENKRSIFGEFNYSYS